MKRLISLLLILIFVLLPMIGFAGENKRFYYNLKEEIRYEYWNTFDKNRDQDNFDYDKSYGYTSSKMRIGGGFNSSLLDGYIQMNWTQFFSLPNDAEFGLGYLYYKFNGKFGIRPDKATDIGYCALSQAWLRFKPPIINGLSITVGRFLYFSGLEGGLSKNSQLNWLKKNRISQRMIGPFDWSRVGRAFDGIMLSFNHDFWNLTASYIHPTPGGFYLKRDDWRQSGKSSHRIDVATLTFSLRYDNPYVRNTDIQLFYYYYNDKRKTSASVKIIDGHDYTAELSGLGDCEIYMIGAHLIKLKKIGSGTADFLLWGGYQWGNWGRGIAAHDHILDHEAWAVAVEAGYRLENVIWKPWFRAGYFYGSGDDDPDDKNHNTFFMMLPTLRIYSLTPSYTFMNSNYFMGQVILNPHKKVLIRSDVHFVHLSEDEDFWYLGSGMMRPDKPSFSAISAHIIDGDRDLLTMWDISLFFNNLYHIKRMKIGLNFYFSHIWGGDVVEDTFRSDDEMTFFYSEIRFTF